MKHFVRIILACIFMAPSATVLSATIEDNTVRIWPANNSLLLIVHEIDFVIHAKLDSPMRRVLVMFDGADITHLLGKFARPPESAPDTSSLLRISIPRYTLSPGVHTVYVEITTTTGQVVSDTAVYTALATITAPGLPPFLGWPCILTVTPCE